MLSPAQKRLCCSLFWKHVLQVRSLPPFWLYMIENVRHSFLLYHTRWGFDLPTHSLRRPHTDTKMPRFTSIEASFDLCFSELSESMRVSFCPSSQCENISTNHSSPGIGASLSDHQAQQSQTPSGNATDASHLSTRSSSQ